MRRIRRETGTGEIAMMAVITKAMGAFLVIMILLLPYYTGDPEAEQTAAATNKHIDDAKKKAKEVADELRNDLRNGLTVDGDGLLSKIDLIEQELDEARTLVDQLKLKLDQASSQIARLEKEVEPLRARVAELERQLAELQAQLASLRAQYDQVRAQNDQLQARNAMLQGQNAQLQQDNDKLQKENEQLKRERQQLARTPLFIEASYDNCGNLKIGDIDLYIDVDAAGDYGGRYAKNGDGRFLDYIVTSLQPKDIIRYFLAVHERASLDSRCTIRLMGNFGGSAFHGTLNVNSPGLYAIGGNMISDARGLAEVPKDAAIDAMIDAGTGRNAMPLLRLLAPDKTDDVKVFEIDPDLFKEIGEWQEKQKVPPFVAGFLVNQIRWNRLSPQAARQRIRDLASSPYNKTSNSASRTDQPADGPLTGDAKDFADRFAGQGVPQVLAGRLAQLVTAKQLSLADAQRYAPLYKVDPAAASAKNANSQDTQNRVLIATSMNGVPPALMFFTIDAVKQNLISIDVLEKRIKELPK